MGEGQFVHIKEAREEELGRESVSKKEGVLRGQKIRRTEGGWRGGLEGVGAAVSLFGGRGRSGGGVAVASW